MHTIRGNKSIQFESRQLNERKVNHIDYKDAGAFEKQKTSSVPVLNCSANIISTKSNSFYDFILLNFIKGVLLVLKAVILLFLFHCNLASASGSKQIMETDEQLLWRELFYSSLLPMTSNLSWNNPNVQ